MIRLRELTVGDIARIKRTIEKNKDNLDVVLRNYRNNVSTISTNLNDMTFSEWEDEMATALSSRRDSLKNGLVSKLNDSVSDKGTLSTLEELISLLYQECEKYLGVFDSDSVPSSDDAMASNMLEGKQKENISYLLDKLAELRFDSDVSLETLPSIEPQTVVINQFDKVKVVLDGEEKDMYYLGTDYKGRSYFSETLEDKATAYVASWPGALGTTEADINHWADQYRDNPWIYSSMVESYSWYVITGGNTGNITKGDVLKKIFGSYANGMVVGDANFNNSIVIENSYFVPEIVERGSNSYDVDNAFHMVNIDASNAVSLASVLQSGVDLSSDYHPDILLKPGEKIEMSYWNFIIKTNCSIGSDTESLLLHYDEDKKQYYVINSETGGYYTAVRSGDALDYGERMITIDKLKDKKTKYTVEE